MADMTVCTMLDDVDLAIEEAHVTSQVRGIAGYVNGRFQNWPAVVARWGKSGKALVSIDVQGNASAGAQCLDVEKGDVDPGNHAAIVAWVKVTRANGVAARDLRYYPKVYTSETNAVAIVDALTQAGVARDTFMLWTAHYQQGPHICGPHTCGCPVQADATQYADSADGVSLDESLCYAYFFDGPPAAAQPAAPAKAPAAPVKAPDPVSPPAPVPVAPKAPAAPVTLPEALSAAEAKAVTAYTQVALDAAIADQLGLPAGCFLFIPRAVKAA